MRAAFWALGALACGTPAPPAVVDPGWIPQWMADPAKFDALVEADRSGWVALHGGVWVPPRDTHSAAEARLDERRAALAAGARRLSAMAYAAFSLEWAKRGAPAHRARVEAFAAAALADGADVAPESVADPLLLPCAHAHAAARAAGMAVAAGPPCTALAQAQPPLPDPFAAVTWQRSLRKPNLGALDGHARVAFSARWVHADEPPEGELAHRIGLDLTTAADTQAVRDQVHAADAQLDALAAAWRAGASVEGLALEQDLALIALWRAEAIRAEAESLLALDRPDDAAMALMLAADATQTKVVGPTSGASLRVAIAEAALKTGRAREALDALSPLRDSWPELVPTIELINDLVVLNSLGEAGQSSE